MKFDTGAPVSITMLGAGGTGGHVAPNLYRLLHGLGREARLTVADGDTVEPGNLVRQNFTSRDLGRNKARALAERYASAFGMEAGYLPEYVENAELLKRLTGPIPYHVYGARGNPARKDGTAILLGCFDNNRSRKLCHEVFMEARNLVYIDSGNGMYSGQVVCGVRRNGRTLSKPAGSLYPEILEAIDRFPSELSCTEAAEASPQSIAANITAAASIMSFLYNILVVGSLETTSVTFSTRSVNTKPAGGQNRKSGPKADPHEKSPPGRSHKVPYSNGDVTHENLRT